MSRAHDLAGFRSGKLVALSRVENDPIGKAQWVCRCDCGGAHIVRSDNLYAKRVRACPTCRTPPERVQITVWYHLELLGFERTGVQGFVDGGAGFAVATCAGKELAMTPWISERVIRGQMHPVVRASIRHFAGMGLIRCGLDSVGVSGWARRNKARVTLHIHNEGDRVWTEWYGRTNEWRGPVDDFSEMPPIYQQVLATEGA